MSLRNISPNRAAPPGSDQQRATQAPHLLGTYVSSDVVTQCALDPLTGNIWTGEESWLRVRSNITGEVKMQHHFRSGRYITAVCLTSRHAWVGHRDGVISVFSLTTASPAAELVLHEGAISCLMTQTISKDGVVNEMVVSISNDGRLGQWDPAEMKCVTCVKLSDQALTCGCLASNDTCIVGSSEGFLYCVSLAQQQPFSTSKVMQSAIRSLALVTRRDGSPHDHLWIGGEDGKIGICDALLFGPTSCRFVQSAHESAVTHMIHCGGGDSRVWTASRASGIVLYDAVTTNVLQTMSGVPGGNTLPTAMLTSALRPPQKSMPTEFPTAISLVAHGYAWRVWTCGSDGTIRAWQTIESLKAPGISSSDGISVFEAHSKCKGLQVELDSCRHEVVILRGKLQEVSQGSGRSDLDEISSLRLETVSLRERLQSALVNSAQPHTNGGSLLRAELDNLRQRLAEELANSRKLGDSLSRSESECSMLRSELNEALLMSSSSRKGAPAPTDLRAPHASILAAPSTLRSIYQSFVADAIICDIEETSRRHILSLEHSSRHLFLEAMNEWSDQLTCRERYERQMERDMAQLRSALVSEESLIMSVRQGEADRLRGSEKIDDLTRELNLVSSALSKARQQLEIAREDESSLSTNLRNLENEKRGLMQREKDLMSELKTKDDVSKHAKDDLDELKQISNSQDAEIRNQRSIARENEEKLAQLSQDRQSLSCKIADLEDRCSIQAFEIQKLKAAVDEHQTEKNHHLSQMEALKLNCQHAQRQAQEIQNENDDLSLKFRSSNRQNLEFKQTAEANQATLLKLQNKLQDLHSAEEESKRNADTLAKSHASLVSQLTAESERLSKLLAESHASTKILEEKLSATQRAAEFDIRAAHEKYDDAARSEARFKEEAIATLETQNNAIMAKLHHTQEEGRKMSMELAELRLNSQRLREANEQHQSRAALDRQQYLSQMEDLQESSKRSERQAQQLVREATEHVEILQADSTKLRTELASKVNLLQDALRDKEKIEVESRRQVCLAQNEMSLMDAEVAALQRQVQEGTFLGDRTILQAEVTELRQQVHSLQRELQLRRGEIRDLEKANDDNHADHALKVRQEQNACLNLKSEVEKLNAMIKIKTSTISSLEQRVEDLEVSAKSSIANQKQSYESGVEKLRLDNASLQKEVRRLDTEFAQCSRNLEAFQHEAKINVRNERMQHQEEIESYKQQIAALQKEVRIRTADLAAAMKQQDEFLSDAQTAIKSEKALLVHANDDLSKRLQSLDLELRTKSHDWNEQKLSMLDRNEDLSAKLRTEKHSRESLEQETEHRMSQLQKELKQKGTEILHLRTLLEDADTDGKQRHRSERFHTDKQNDVLKDQVGMLERELLVKTSDIVMLQRIVDEKDIEHQLRWRDDRSNYEQQIALHREDLAACRDVIKTKERELTDIREQCHKYKGDLSKLMFEKSTLEGELESTRAQLARQIEKSKLLQASLTSSDEVHHAMSTMQKETSALSDKVNEKEVEVRKLRSQIQISETLVEEMRQQFRGLQDQYKTQEKRLEDQLSDAARENQQLRQRLNPAVNNNAEYPHEDSARRSNQQAVAELARRDEILRSQMISMVELPTRRGPSGYEASRSGVTGVYSSVVDTNDLLNLRADAAKVRDDMTQRHARQNSPPHRRRGPEEFHTPYIAAEAAASILFQSASGRSTSGSNTTAPSISSARPTNLAGLADSPASSVGRAKYHYNNTGARTSSTTQPGAIPSGFTKQF